MPRPNPIQRARAIGPGRIGAMSRPSGTPLGNQIVSITNNAGQPQMTTAGPHGLDSDAGIVISGNSVPGYNGAQITSTVVSPTVILLQGEYTSDGTGGTWALA